MIRRHLAVALIATLAGCGSSTSSNGNGGAGGVGGNGAGGGGGGSDGGSSGGGGGGGGGSMIPTGIQLGTYIVLGDSISDGGGTGPFFYEQLENDLKAKFPNLTYVHAAKAGAITDTFSDNTPAAAPLLKTQIAGLGTSYPGDILVTITIGGNDLNSHAIAAIAGTDGTVRGEFGTHLDAELAELTTAARLGSGKVYIVLANIYDFTDGMGDFATVKCGPGANVQAARDQSTFSGWNGVSATAIQKVGGTLYDMHADFAGHGYNNTNADDVWYDKSSCIHPNAKGHDAIRHSVYKLVTGEALP